MGVSGCPSLRYHHLHPDYIHQRLRELGRGFVLRVLLLQVDVKDPQRALKDLAKICVLSDCTLLLAWSPEEAARYLETYKAFEQKPPDLLRERLDHGFLPRVSTEPIGVTVTPSG
ncbi:DNA excision repair protein ERCC-1-like [Pezoporus wallicus]|nr:DNA excision repair protein ERCC-1-like [Pezoporus wallicus]